MLEMRYEIIEFSDINEKINSINEENNIERFIVPKSENNEKSRLRSAVGYMLMTKMLQDKGITDFTLEKGENGKPILTDTPYYFNISHSGNVVICVLSDSEVGVDIEEVKCTKNIENIAKRYFTEDEYNEVLGALDEEKHQLFTRIWTEKESYTKYLGLGISKKFSEFYKDKLSGCVIDNGIDTKIKYSGGSIDKYLYSICSKYDY